MLFILFLVFSLFFSAIFNFLEKLCVTKMKMFPACRDPKVSDGELVKSINAEAPIRSRVAVRRICRFKKKVTRGRILSKKNHFWGDKRRSRRYKNMFALF